MRSLTAMRLYINFFLAAAVAQKSLSQTRPRKIWRAGTCSDDQDFTCRNGDCVYVRNARCDGVFQCPDLSDEEGCPGQVAGSCILPQQPVGGSFKLICSEDSCDSIVGGRIPHGSLLNYTCNVGYTLSGRNMPFCHSNAWSLLPSCAITCPALTSGTVDIGCRYHGRNVSCEHEIFPGTTATLTCKHSHKFHRGSHPTYRKIICRGNGKWDRPLFACVAECGKPTPRGNPLIVGGTPAKYGDFPWHVGIYVKNLTGLFEHKYGGTLINRRVVISAAHCCYNETSRGVVNFNDFMVLGGKYYPAYERWEAHSQYSGVSGIEIPNEFNGYDGSYSHDIAIIYLAAPFNITSYVKPICIDWENQFENEQLQNGQIGKVMGWGLTARGSYSSELQTINLPYVDSQTCIDASSEEITPFITRDKFCAGYLNGSSTCIGDAGSGLGFEYSGLWYLRGIVSVQLITDDGTCDTHSYTAFTNVGYFLKWIRNATLEPGDQNYTFVVDLPSENDLIFDDLSNATSTSIECILPVQPKYGKSFVLRGCGEQCDVAQGLKVPLGSYLLYRPNWGYRLEGDSISRCHNGTWSSPPTHIKKCPKLESRTANIVCNYKDEIVSCISNIVRGTKATVVCKDGFRFRRHKGRSPSFKELTCQANGKWNQAIPHCIPRNL